MNVSKHLTLNFSLNQRRRKHTLKDKVFPNSLVLRWRSCIVIMFGHNMQLSAHK